MSDFYLGFYPVINDLESFVTCKLQPTNKVRVDLLSDSEDRTRWRQVGHVRLRECLVAGWSDNLCRRGRRTGSQETWCCRYDELLNSPPLYHSHHALHAAHTATNGQLLFQKDVYPNTLIPCLHDRPNIDQTSSKCIQNTRANCWTSARCLLAFIQLARRAMVISMLIRRAGRL